jgi:hypothetical protein
MPYVVILRSFCSNLEWLVTKISEGIFSQLYFYAHFTRVLQQKVNAHAIFVYHSKFWFGSTAHTFDIPYVVILRSFCSNLEWLVTKIPKGIFSQLYFYAHFTRVLQQKVKAHAIFRSACFRTKSLSLENL